VQDSEAQSVLEIGLNQHNSEYRVKCLGSLITAQESRLLKLKETLQKQLLDFEARLQVLIEPLKRVTLLRLDSNDTMKN